MARITLAWQNRADEATLSGGSWLSTLPLANIKNRQVQKVARSTNDANASTKFDVDLGQARRIDVLALVVHNISVLGRVRITGDDASNFATPLYESGWIDVWQSGMIPAELLEWEDDNFWLGTLSADARAGYQSPFIHQLTSGTTARYWRVEVDDTANSDGYVQIGRLFLAASWTPDYSYTIGAGLKYDDPTPIEESLSGAEFFEERSRARVFRFALDGMTAEQAYTRTLELQRLCGISGEVLVIPDSDDADNMTRRAYVGRLRQLGDIIQAGSAHYSAQFELKELL